MVFGNGVKNIQAAAYNCPRTVIVNFVIQKSKINTFPKKYKNWAKLNPLILTEREETKFRYFAP